MRKIFVLFCLCFIVCFASCSSTKEVVVQADEIPILQICPMGPGVTNGTNTGDENENNENPNDVYMENTAKPFSIEEYNGTKVTITSEIPEMDVYINSIFQGRTNISILGLLPGEYILDLKKEGYESFRCFLTVENNRNKTYFFNLEQIKTGEL